MLRRLIVWWRGRRRRSKPVDAVVEAELRLAQERRRLAETLARFDDGVHQHQRAVRELEVEQSSLNAERSALRQVIEALLAAESMRSAGKQALRLQTVETELPALGERLAHARSTVDRLVAARDAVAGQAHAHIGAIERGLVELKTARLLAQMNERARGALAELDGSGDSLRALATRIEEERIRAAASARVAGDQLPPPDPADAVREQQALERFVMNVKTRKQAQG